MLLRASSVPFAALAVLISLAGGAPAHAQEAGKAGLVAGYPASVGVLWHVSDGVALRPEVAFQHQTGESKGGSSSTVATSNITAVTFAVSGLFYVGKWENLRSYLSPKFTYARQTNENGFANSTVAASTSTNSFYGVAGSFGAEYALGRRFAVFGEAGIGYTHQANKLTSEVPSTFRPETTANLWATRSAVGIIYYF